MFYIQQQIPPKTGMSMTIFFITKGYLWQSIGYFDHQWHLIFMMHIKLQYLNFKLSIQSFRML